MNKKELIAKNILEWYSHILFIEEAYDIADIILDTKQITINGIKSVLSRYLLDCEDGELDGLVFTIRDILQGDN
jgi:hypothetical protein